MACDDQSTTAKLPVQAREAHHELKRGVGCAIDCNRLGQDALDVQVEDDVDHDGDDEEQEGDHGEYVDLVADALEVFKELLLLESVAVGGFAHRLKLIFDAFERGILIGDLGAEFALLGLERADALFEWGEIDGRRWRRRGRGPVGRRGHEVGDGGADVAIEQRKDALNEGQRGADGVDQALNAGGRVCFGRRRVGCGLGRGQGTAKGKALAGLG